MQKIRFYAFAQTIDSIHKSIYKIKNNLIPLFGVKSVHMFWIYELFSHPDGISAAELAERAMVSRSLVSREIDLLTENGYVALHENGRGKRRNYNSRITLTEKGVRLAERIQNEALSVQGRVDDGITPQELEAFYATLEKLKKNLQSVAQEIEQNEICSQKSQK